MHVLALIGFGHQVAGAHKTKCVREKSFSMAFRGLSVACLGAYEDGRGGSRWWRCVRVAMELGVELWRWRDGACLYPIATITVIA